VVSTIPLPDVLLVDDDPQVRRCLNAALRRDGFRVWVAGDGEQAVELYREHQARIGVVLLDVQMPGVDGPQTLSLLRDINPDVRVVFMSGNPGRYTEEELCRRGALSFLKKPFPSIAAVSHHLRQLTC
jgi:DNA-binding NtrC family response regulator